MVANPLLSFLLLTDYESLGLEPIIAFCRYINHVKTVLKLYRLKSKVLGVPIWVEINQNKFPDKSCICQSDLEGRDAFPFLQPFVANLGTFLLLSTSN